MNNIEDAIKRCKEIISKCDDCKFATCEQCEINWTDIQAIKIVLGNLEALCDMQKSADRELENAKKINEEHKKDNGELREKIKELDKTNNDLRLLYRRTANKLLENGKTELAGYFLAQINKVPTFTVDEDIDYYEEYYKLKEENLHWRGQYYLVTRKIGVIPIKKIKKIVDECIPKKTNIITNEIEYTPNANANSYLTQQILELLQESEDK